MAEVEMVMRGRKEVPVVVGGCLGRGGVILVAQHVRMGGMGPSWGVGVMRGT